MLCGLGQKGPGGQGGGPLEGRELEAVPERGPCGPPGGRFAPDKTTGQLGNRAPPEGTRQLKTPGGQIAG